MKRYRYKLPSWDEGRALAKRIADELALEYDERDETIVVHDPNDQHVSISFFLDPREFTFITVKLFDEHFKDKIQPYFTT